MVAYNFLARFAPAIRAGLKRHTIRSERAGRSRHARPGEPVQLYQGMRTRHCRLIAAPLCEAVWPVELALDPGAVILPHAEFVEVADLDVFARSDGFGDWPDMTAFWRQRHPGVVLFSGVLIRWVELTEADLAQDGARRGGQMDLFGSEASP